MNNKQSNLAIFDLDNTLIRGDSDHAWGEFVCEKGLVDIQTYRKKNDAFYDDYMKGTLDISSYLRFSLSTLKGRKLEDLNKIREEFLKKHIEPLKLSKAIKLLKMHRDSGDYLLIITATNSFIANPIADMLEVDDVLSSEAEIKSGAYTGEPLGIPCFQEGKVQRLKIWLKENSYSLENSFFYSDSHNDIPLMKIVDNPVAVDADEKLNTYAFEKNWPRISLRD
jgi:HAD superfamily hydrolase (TIGR01490 family)